VQRLRGKIGLQAVLGLGGVAVLLLVLAVIGAVKVSNDNGGSKTATKAAGGATQVNSGIQPGQAAPSTSSTAAARAATPAPGAAAGSVGTAAPSAGGSTAAGSTTKGTLPSAPGATRLGVSQSTIKVGIHAPVTLNGAPLSIAADAIEGIKSYIAAINQAGGVNGRTIDYQIADDRYTVDGGKQAANQLVNDYKPFIISGTLGIDQIFQVASAAHGAGIPYMAAGGPDQASDIFRNLGMYEIAGTYDMHMSKLADFLGKEIQRLGSPYHLKTKVGVSVLNSPYILPSVKPFSDALARNGLSLVKSVAIEKPTDQTSYGTQLQQLRDAGTQIFVPMQDPITTSREVAECRTQGCSWTYSFSDFAHDGDPDLALMQGEFTRLQVEGLSSACYYNAQNANDPKFCAAMGSAHQIWIQQHGGGQKGEVDWQQHGSGGSAGYQVDHFFLKAMKDMGTDPTREKFVASLNAYNGYDDLVTGPISLNQPDHMRGVSSMVVLQAGVGHYSQITPGLVDQF
jgi:ABC-type branched-subunit amino acid transport system substrate-binding protein